MSCSLSTKKVLFITHRVPYPPDKGDRIRTYHMLRFLAQHARVWLACLSDEDVTDQHRVKLTELTEHLTLIPAPNQRTGALKSLLLGKTATVGAFHSREMARALEVLAPVGFDAVIASSSGVAPYLRLPALQNVPALVDLVDFDSQKWLDYAAASSPPKSWLYHLEGRRLRREEQAIVGWAKAVTLVSRQEADLFRQAVSGTNVSTLTNGVDLDYYQPQPSEENGCVFVGALDYRPNVDAAVWFSETIWPLLHQRHPEATLKLVGRKPAPAVERLASLPGIEVIGQVPDVRPYVHASAVSIAPLRIARGLQNKVLEAMAMAKPVVATPQALAGLVGGPPSPAICCESIQEWQNQLDSLLMNPQRRHSMGHAGRQFVEANHDWNRCLKPLVELLRLDQPSSSAIDRLPVAASNSSDRDPLPAGSYRE